MLLLKTAIFLVLFHNMESVLQGICKEAGVFPHPEDCTQYIICAEDHGRIFLAETVPCPEGYSYSEEERTCVRSKQCQPVPGRTTRATTGGPCKASGPYCEGCDRLIVCANIENQGLVPLTNISCSQVDGDMSCSKASCSSQPSTENCDGLAGNFRCLQPGFFADPTNCKRFHVCSSDLSHYSGECDDQYNPILGTCTSVDPDNKPTDPGSAAQTTPQCSNLQNPCTGANTVPQKFPSYPSYYIVCIPMATKSRKSSVVYQISVAKCPGNQEFNEKTISCEFSCTGKRGRFQDPDDCRSYLECVSGASGPGVKKPCPDNFAFDPLRRSCLPESMVKTCQRITTTTTAAPPVTTTAVAVSTNTQAAAGSSEFQCRETGAFPDTSDCRKFTTCSLEARENGYSFRMAKKECPWFTYFNRNGYCLPGLCWFYW